MSTRRWFVLGGVVVVVMVVALLAMTRPQGVATPSIPVGSGGLVPAATITARPVPTASAGATPAAPAPSATVRATQASSRPPRATGDPRLAYAEFLLRVNGDRSTMERLTHDMSTAAEAQDADAVHDAAVAILDFVDVERDWLRAHPPADCYAAAHASANAMLEAYGLAADRFVSWAASGGGLAGLAALGEALDAADEAGNALAVFGRALESTTCQA